MRPRLLPLAVATALASSALAFGPAATTPADDCPDTVGREMLTVDGFEHSFGAPTVTAPELAATADVTGDAITPHRSAHYLFTVDAAPYDEVEITATLEWSDTPSDYDLYGYAYQQGFRYGIGTSNESNIDGGDTRVETFTATVDDCRNIDIEARSWAGNPAQVLDLTIEVTPVGEPRADETERDADTRLQLFLSGDYPGNVTTPADTAGADYPFGATFSENRPSTGTFNAITRPVVGSTIEKNPVQPWWAGQLDDFPVVQGSPSALLWLSSATQQQDPGTVFVQLFLNGSEHTVEIPGSELTPDVKPFLVEFPEIDAQVFEFSLQVSALPVASPNTASEHLGDANHTVFYDSVQYQSKLFLPTVATD